MLKELSEDLNSLKKVQSEMKDTLTKTKNNLQRNNSSGGEAEIQINDMECKELITTKRKKLSPPKKTRVV